jgi:hypothetical protein
MLLGVSSASFARAYEIPPLTLNEAAVVDQAKAINLEMDGWLTGLKVPQNLVFPTACESYALNFKRYGLDYDPLTHWLNYQGLDNYPQIHHATFLAHEYGHVIFRANIKKVSLSLDDDMAGTVAYRDLMRTQLKQTSATTCELEDGSEELLKAARRKLENNDYFTFYAVMLGAYDELFADMLAVMYTGRGDAVFQAVGGASVDWSKKYYIHVPSDYRGRDFTYPTALKDWHKDSPNLVFYDLLGAVSDFYNALDPVRYYLWENYLKTLPREKYADFISAYLDAVAPEFQRYLDEDIWEQPIEEMNIRFIQGIDKQMQLHKIPKAK